MCFCRAYLLAGEHDLHSENITCGAYRRYKCRSVDSDYQSNCIALTLFIITYFFMPALSPQNQSHLCTALKYYNHCMFFSITIPFCPSTGAYGDLHTSNLSNQAWDGLGTTCPFIKQIPSNFCFGRKCKSWFCCRD
jgi:hypothetical protein